MTYLVHDKFMDVFFEVFKTQYTGPNYRKIRGRWWNLGFSGKPWLIPANPQTITIQNSDWPQWKFFDPSQPETHPGRKSNV